MSRLIRQTGQLSRLVRITQTTTIQRSLKGAVAARAAVPYFAIPARPNQVRFYSSNTPKPEDDRKAESKTPEEHNAKTTETETPAAEESKVKLAPLLPGWVRLTKDEIDQLAAYQDRLPDGQKEFLTDALSALSEIGAPEDLRSFLQKLKKGPGHIGILDRGRLLRSVFQVAERMAWWEVEKKKTSGEMFTQNDQPADQNANAENNSSANNNSGNNQGQQSSGQNSNQTPPPNPPKNPIMDIIQTTIVLGITLWAFNSLTSPASQTEITWQEMRKNFLDKGLVKKFVVINGTKVQVELRSSSEGVSDSGERKSYTFTIGSVESFERKLDQAQSELGIPSAERIPVSYESGGSTLGNILLAFGPTLLIVGLILYSQRSMGGRGGAGGMFNFGKSRAKKFNAENSVKVKFADVAGMEEAKTEIMEFVSFLKQPEKFEKLGAKIPRGAILAGPPGTGKTLLAKATAGESGVPFFSVSGSEFVEMFVGVGPSRVRDLFAEGRKNAPCIIFIDEIDAIGRARQESRGFGGNDEREATLNQILTEMDGFNTREQVVVLAGTNRADILDKALMRPGRFDRHIYIDRPTMSGRKEIFKVYLNKIVTNEDHEHLVGRLATLTPGFSGADIANVVNEAALIAARGNADDVKMEHFERAIERVIGGLERKSLVLKPEEKKTVAYHEAGHAICGWFLQHADPLLKVSIIPRGQGALGYAQYLPQDAYLMNVNQLMDRMAMTMGGRVSEEMHFPTVTTGASDDFKKVSDMARNMVTQWGMSEKVGPIHFENDPNRVQKPFAESTAQQIDQEVHRIVDEAYKRCKDLLMEKKKEVGIIAQELLKKEVLVRDDMVRLLGKRPFDDNAEFEKYFGGSKEESSPPPFPHDPPTTPPAPAFKDLS